MGLNLFKISKGLGLKGQSSAPSSPANGDMYYDSTLNKFQAYENGAWVNVIGSSAAILPTSMTDSDATALGYKVYKAGVSYNGGNSFTFSATGTSGVGYDADFIPYQTQDGDWRLRGNFYYSYTSGGLNYIAILCTNILAKNIANMYYAVAVDIYSGATAQACKGRIQGGWNGFELWSYNTAANKWYVSFDIALDSKPNWAY